MLAAAALATFTNEAGAAKGNHYSTELLTLARFNLAWLAAGAEQDKP